jgi:glycosyltransferase involved in cell wall biosynthesis
MLSSAIGQLLGELEQRGWEAEVIIAENGSTDATPELAESLAGAEPRLRAIHLEKADYGRALREGFLAGREAYLANFSVDFMDVDFLHVALSRLERCDLVLGSKYVAAHQDQRPAARRICGRLLSGFVRMLFHLPVADTHGLLAMRRENLLPLLEACRFGNEVFDTELVVRAHRAGVPMCEIPVAVEEQRPTRLGSAKRAGRMLAQLAQLRLVLWREGQA